MQGIAPMIAASMPSRSVFAKRISCMSQNIYTRDNIAPSVAFLRQPLPNNQASVGTGFFVESKGKIFLVTAEHVETPLRDTAEIVVSEIGTNKPIILRWADLVQQSTKPSWKRHPIADISVLELNPTQATFNTWLQKRFLPFSIFPKDQISPSRDVFLTSLGYPLGLGTQGLISPLTFDSRAASGFLTLNRFDNNKPCTFFILQDPTIGGYSGCPIFDLSIVTLGSMTTTGSGTKCWGITHGTISDPTGGKLAAITPIFYLHSLIPA